jgi:hypothetical protein
VSVAAEFRLSVKGGRAFKDMRFDNSLQIQIGLKSIDLASDAERQFRIAAARSLPRRLDFHLSSGCPALPACFICTSSSGYNVVGNVSNLK